MLSLLLLASALGASAAGPIAPPLIPLKPYYGSWKGKQSCLRFGADSVWFSLEAKPGEALGRYSGGSGALRPAGERGSYTWKAAFDLGLGRPLELSGGLRVSADGSKADFDAAGALVGGAALEGSGRRIRYWAKLQVLGLEESCSGELERSEPAKLKGPRPGPKKRPPKPAQPQLVPPPPPKD